MQLILIRHAKSSWEFNLNDKERPINDRGIDDAKLVFKTLKNVSFSNYEVWCSSAKRTIQTAALFSLETGFDFDKIIFKDKLYTFEINSFIKCLHMNNSDKLIIFGHNNAITDFVNKFGNYYIENIPTCGVVMLQFDTNLFTKTTKGTIQQTIFPRNLKK